MNSFYSLPIQRLLAMQGINRSYSLLTQWIFTDSVDHYSVFITISIYIHSLLLRLACIHYNLNLHPLTIVTISLYSLQSQSSSTHNCYDYPVFIKMSFTFYLTMSQTYSFHLHIIQ